MKYVIPFLLLVFLAACAPQQVGEPRACCMAMTAECLACAEDITPEEYCVQHPETIGCEPSPPLGLNPCAATTCMVGNECQVIDGEGVCVSSEYTECTEPRPEICTKEYNPVCATVDTGARCITEPCDVATKQETYSTGCTACADKNVYGYVPGACQVAQPKTNTLTLCGTDQLHGDSDECVDSCPEGYDHYGGQIAEYCFPHMGPSELDALARCENANDCSAEEYCALVSRGTDGSRIKWAAEDAFRCAPAFYTDYMSQNADLTIKGPRTVKK